MTNEMLVGAVIALIFNEMVDVCPWIAQRLVRRATNRIPNPKLAARYREEWLGVVERRPGKLLKLAVAVNIVVFGARKVRALSRPKPTASRLRRRRALRPIAPFTARGSTPRVVDVVLLSLAAGAGLWGSGSIAWSMAAVTAGIATTRMSLAAIRARRRPVLPFRTHRPTKTNRD